MSTNTIHIDMMRLLVDRVDDFLVDVVTTNDAHLVQAALIDFFKLRRIKFSFSFIYFYQLVIALLREIRQITRIQAETNRLVMTHPSSPIIPYNQPSKDRWLHKYSLVNHSKNDQCYHSNTIKES